MPDPIDLEPVGEVPCVGGPLDGRRLDPGGSVVVYAAATECDRGRDCDCHKPAAHVYHLVKLAGFDMRFVLQYQGRACGVCPPDCIGPKPPGHDGPGGSLRYPIAHHA